MQKADFEGHLGEEFRILPEGQDPLVAKLHEVSGLAADSESRDPFSILFLAPETPLLPQKIYGVENDALGRLELFLVPLGPTRDEGGMIYEAVFS